MEHYLFSTLAYLITIIVIHLVYLFPLAVALVIIECFLGRVSRSWKARGVRTDLGYLILSALYGPLAHYFLALLLVLSDKKSQLAATMLMMPVRSATTPTAAIPNPTQACPSRQAS